MAPRGRYRSGDLAVVGCSPYGIMIRAGAGCLVRSPRARVAPGCESQTPSSARPSCCRRQRGTRWACAFSAFWLKVVAFLVQKKNFFFFFFGEMMLGGSPLQPARGRAGTG